MGQTRQFGAPAGGRTPRQDPVNGGGGGGGQGGFAFPVDTIARASASELVNLDATLFPDGTLVFVRSVRDFFVLHKTSALTADDITIADAIGGGQWLRKFTPSVRWLSQAAWFIDPAAADDEGDGSGGDPLQTHAELGRRAICQGREITQSVTVTIVASLPETDPVEIDVQFPQTSLPQPPTIRYVGTATTVRSGTFTGVTALVSGTALPTITDGVGGSFAAQIRQRVRMIGGANVGARSWLVRDDGGSMATTSAWWLPSALIGASAPTLSDPTTDDYVVETFPSVRLSRVKMSEGPIGGLEFIPLVFEDLFVGSINTDAPPRLTNLDATLFQGCELSATLHDKAYLAATGCLLQRAVGFQRSTVVLRASAIVGTGYGATGSTVAMSEETTAMGVPLVTGVRTFDTRFILATASGFDAGAGQSGVELPADCTMRVGGLLWGTGNATYGINALGGKLYAANFLPTITGAVDDTRVGGIDKAYALLPFFNAANGACVVDTPT